MPDKPAGLMISAPKKSSGKTTLSLGIAGALKDRGTRVRVFKKGPDYIDPMWHKLNTGYKCYNIDPYWMDDETCRKIFAFHGRETDISLVEGNHGLHDGLDVHGKNSSAHLAKLLGVPVILALDSSGMNRGIAAIVLGSRDLDPDVKIGGVVLNNVATRRQVNKQIAAIEHYCGIPVLGALPRNEDIRIKERHLGLITIHENDLANEVIDSAARMVRENCDLDRIQSLADSSLDFSESPASRNVRSSCSSKTRATIAVARDKAFCFYYEDNFEALKAAGAELTFFDAMRDKELPEADGVYIGGGFPESFLKELEENRSLREELRLRIEEGLPVYAECGGLMYLTRSITREGEKRNMVGAIPADVEFQKKPVGKGYSELSAIPGTGWFQPDRIIKGHEFHYSRLTNVGSDIECAFSVRRGTGIDGKRDGIVHKNVLAAYTHLHALAVPEWAEGFVAFVAGRRS